MGNIGAGFTGAVTNANSSLFLIWLELRMAIYIQGFDPSPFMADTGIGSNVTKRPGLTPSEGVAKEVGIILATLWLQLWCLVKFS